MSQDDDRLFDSRLGDSQEDARSVPEELSETPPPARRSTRREIYRDMEPKQQRVVKDAAIGSTAFGAIAVAIIWAAVSLVTGGHAEQQAQKPAESAKPAANETTVASTTVSGTESAPAKKASRKSAPAPAESVPTTGTSPWVQKNIVDDPTPGPRIGKITVPPELAPKPSAKPLFEAKLSSEFQDFVSYKLTDSEKGAEAFSGIATAAGLKFEAADKGERAYTRGSGSMAITGVSVTATEVTVTFKANPAPEQLQKLTKPMQELTKSLGLPTEGKWTGDGPVKTFVFQAGIPAGMMK